MLISYIRICFTLRDKYCIITVNCIETWDDDLAQSSLSQLRTLRSLKDKNNVVKIYYIYIIQSRIEVLMLKV